MNDFIPPWRSDSHQSKGGGQLGPHWIIKISNYLNKSKQIFVSLTKTLHLTNSTQQLMLWNKCSLPWDIWQSWNFKRAWRTALVNGRYAKRQFSQTSDDVDSFFYYSAIHLIGFFKNYYLKFKNWDSYNLE